MRFCMGWSEWVSEREGGEGRYWDGNGVFFFIYGRLGYGNGL